MKNGTQNKGNEASKYVGLIVFSGLSPLIVKISSWIFGDY